MEFKQLKTKAPTGVYVMPTPDCVREWHGVIFLRASFYRGAVFKFTISIPDQYPKVLPKVVFKSDVFNPLVDPKSGELDLSLEFPSSRGEVESGLLVLVLAYIKRIFYRKEDWQPVDGHTAANPEAELLFQTNPEEFISRCEACALTSATNENMMNNDPKAGIKLVSPKKEHKDIFDKLLQRGQAEAGEGIKVVDLFSDRIHSTTQSQHTHPETPRSEQIKS